MVMAKLTKKQLDAPVVQQAMAELGITVPVRAWKIEDERLLLQLATGALLVWGPQSGKLGFTPYVAPDA
jgi:hypothetical protein